MFFSIDSDLKEENLLKQVLISVKGGNARVSIAYMLFKSFKTLDCFSREVFIVPKKLWYIMMSIQCYGRLLVS